jgi:hypothetical protein
MMCGLVFRVKAAAGIWVARYQSCHASAETVRFHGQHILSPCWPVARPARSHRLRVGIAARGIVFLAIGWLLSRAAREHDPNKAGGIGQALDALTQLGRVPFLAIATGLIAYGLYQLLSARYRTIRA